MPAKSPGVAMINSKQKTSSRLHFAVQTDYSLKIIEIETSDKYLGLARGLKSMEHESDSDTDRNLGDWNCPKRLD